MSLNFPDPAVTQTYTEAGITWTWNAGLGVWSSDTVSADADDLYLSKVNNDAAAGAITFKGLTTHEAGVSVTGGDSDTADISLDGSDRLYFSKQIHNKEGIVVSNSTEPVAIPLVNVNYRLIPNGQADNRPETGYVLIRSRASFTSGDSANHVSCFLASTMDGVNNANIQNQYAFYAGGSLSTAFNNYGFYSNLGANGHQGGAAYNFYAAGDAPNYFAGNITCDGLINGAFSLRMETDDPAAFQTTYTTDEEGNQVEQQEYTGTTEDLLAIIKDLRARLAALEAGSVASLEERVATLETADSIDNAGDAGTLALIAELMTRVSVLEATDQTAG